ncbi:MAG TPA: acyltransferase [Microbacterium sp.]|uniref:acyltransferase family protein n=1 Tax=Microbacterium sp. TaxID=51671 RepID=UPI000EDED44B|nr:acyltransferase [Microbacterium sp.]
MAIAPPLQHSVPVPERTSTRDTGIDFVRALCVLGVVLLHSMMVGVTVTASGPVFENASDGTAWIAPLSWLLQVMPLFFVIAGFSGPLAYKRLRERGGTPAQFISGRIHRLLLPAVFTVGIVGAALVMLAVAGVPAELITVAGFRYAQPLWFLGVFLFCQAMLPVLIEAHRRAPLLTIGALASAAVSVDVIRAASGIDGLGFINLAFVWMTLQQLGFFLADGSIGALSRRTRAFAAVTAVAALILTFVCGIYSPDLIANINPPTAALLLVGIAHTAVLSLLRDHLNRFSRRPAIAAFTGFVTPRTMTIYLWHMPVLLVMAGATAIFSLLSGVALPALSSFEWWLGRPFWLASALAITTAVVLVFARIEAHPAPTAAASLRRVAVATSAGLIAVVILLVFGTTPLTACIAVLMAALALYLAQAGSSRTAQVTSAPWPSRSAGTTATRISAMQNT